MITTSLQRLWLGALVSQFAEPDPASPAVGDLHGDLDKAISALKLAQCIAVSGEGVVSWIGGDTTLVQLGDVLDRGDVEIGEWG